MIGQEPPRPPKEEGRGMTTVSLDDESQAGVAADREHLPAESGADHCTLADASLAEESNNAPAAAAIKPPSLTFASEAVDLECASGKRIMKPPAHLSLRYYIMLLALISPFIVTYSRTIINFAIIDMIDPNFLARNNSKQPHLTSTGAPVSVGDANQTITMSSVHPEYFELDNSCPVDKIVGARLLNELESDERRTIESTGEKFQWDTDKQGYLKAAYSIGHTMFQVAGGRLSEIYGSLFIMSISACMIALCCLLAPFLASIHFYLLFIDLLFLGILGSFMTPSLITLISNWLTPGEKSLMMSFYMVSSRLGFALSSLLCGLLMNAHLSWRYLFYSAGWISFVFGNLFYFCSSNRPQDHPLMSEAELEYLASKNTLVREALAQRSSKKIDQTELKPVGVDANKSVEATDKDKDHQYEHENDIDNSNSGTTKAGRKDNQEKARLPPAPWRAILTNSPVWAFIVTKFCVKLMGDTVQTELPVYLKRVMHIESKYNGYINAANYVIFCISCIAVGTLAKWVNKQRPFGWTKTTVRKIFQCTASFGVSVVLFGVSMSVCQETATLSLFMIMFFLTTFSTGGEAQLPLDLSERYAGTIHALGSTLAISGAIEPIIVGRFLMGHSADKDRWTSIWLSASAISFLGGIIFLVLGDAKIQPFDDIEPANATAADETNNEKTNDMARVIVNGYQETATTVEDESTNESDPKVPN